MEVKTTTEIVYHCTFTEVEMQDLCVILTESLTFHEIGEARFRLAKRILDEIVKVQ